MEQAITNHAVALAEAIPLMAQMEKTIYDLRMQINESATLHIEKGETPEPEQDVHELIDELHRVQNDLLKLRLLCAQANQNTLVDYYDEFGNQLTLAEALLLVKQMRETLSLYKSLALRPAKPVRLRLSSDLFEVASFDPSIFKKKARSLERKVNRLSAEIDRANFNTTIEYDVSYYMDLVE